MSGLKRLDLVRITEGGKVYKVIRFTREGRVFLSADADHPDAAQRLPDANMTYDPDSLIRVDD
jgi:hypothetical protein